MEFRFTQSHPEDKPHHIDWRMHAARALNDANCLYKFKEEAILFGVGPEEAEEMFWKNQGRQEPYVERVTPGVADGALMPWEFE